MCKGRLHEKIDVQQVTLLSKDCPILDDWISDDRSHYKRRSINLARLTFGLGRVEDTWKLSF